MAGSVFSILDRLLAQQKMALMDVLQGVRSGLSDHELMLRYRLTPEEMERAFTQLLAEKLIEPIELEGRTAPVLRDYRMVSPRSTPRRFPTFDVKVRFEDDHGQEGYLLDVNEKGLAVQGLGAFQGEVRTLTVMGDEVFELDLFTFQARCRWVRGNGCNGGRLCGFEILDMPEETMEDFRQWLCDCTEIEDWGDPDYEDDEVFEDDSAQPTGNP
jgi:hypothetical protein